MSTRAEAKDILLKEFIANFSATIPVSWENKDEFFFCTGVKTNKPTKVPWVRFKIQNNQSPQISYGSEGNRKFKRSGLISCQVFIPSGTGTEDGDTICEDIVSIFEGKRFTDIYCYAGTYIEMGIQSDGFYGFKVIIFFDTDEQK